MVKHVDQGAYSITNLGSGFKAFVKDEEKVQSSFLVAILSIYLNDLLDQGASVDGNSDKGVHFAIEPAGMNEYTVSCYHKIGKSSAPTSSTKYTGMYP